MTLHDAEGAAKCSRRTEQDFRNMLATDGYGGLVAIDANASVVGVLIVRAVGARFEIEVLEGKRESQPAMIYELMHRMGEMAQNHPAHRTLWAMLPLTMKYARAIEAMAKLGWICDLVPGEDKRRQHDHMRLLFHIPKQAAVCV
jgi:hypothetical protein